jgi:hypothetical protein
VVGLRSRTRTSALGCVVLGLGLLVGRGVVQFTWMNSARTVDGLGRPATGISPRPTREKGIPSNLLLDHRLIHLLSLYREVLVGP